MPWTREDKVFCVTTYLERKSFKTVQANFAGSLTLTIIPRKANFIIGYTNNLNKKPVNPKSSKKFTAR